MAKYLYNSFYTKINWFLAEKITMFDLISGFLQVLIQNSARTEERWYLPNSIRDFKMLLKHIFLTFLSTGIVIEYLIDEDLLDIFVFFRMVKLYALFLLQSEMLSETFRERFNPIVVHELLFIIFYFQCIFCATHHFYLIGVYLVEKYNIFWPSSQYVTPIKLDF